MKSTQISLTMLIVLVGLVNADDSYDALASMFAAIDKPAPTRAKVVVGYDDRAVYNNSNNPFTGIGRVLYGKYQNRACTGYLVGPRHVLTNSHCHDPRFPIYYFPSYNNGNNCNRVGKAVYVYNGTLGIDTTVNTTTLPNGFSVANDWAVLVLSEPISTNDCSYGIFKVASDFDSSWYKKTIFNLAGYPNAGDKNKYGALPVIQYNCSVVSYDSIFRYFYHNCDTNSGSSGSGIFAYINNAWTIVALNNAELGSNCSTLVQRQCGNIAIYPTKYAPYIAQALTAYP